MRVLPSCLGWSIWWSRGGTSRPVSCHCHRRWGGDSAGTAVNLRGAEPGLGAGSGARPLPDAGTTGLIVVDQLDERPACWYRRDGFITLLEQPVRPFRRMTGTAALQGTVHTPDKRCRTAGQVSSNWCRSGLRTWSRVTASYPATEARHPRRVLCLLSRTDDRSISETWELVNHQGAPAGPPR